MYVYIILLSKKKMHTLYKQKKNFFLKKKSNKRKKGLVQGTWGGEHRGEAGYAPDEGGKAHCFSKKKGG